MCEKSVLLAFTTSSVEVIKSFPNFTYQGKVGFSNGFHASDDEGRQLALKLNKELSSVQVDMLYVGREADSKAWLYNLKVALLNSSGESCMGNLGDRFKVSVDVIPVLPRECGAVVSTNQMTIGGVDNMYMARLPPLQEFLPHFIEMQEKWNLTIKIHVPDIDKLNVDGTVNVCDSVSGLSTPNEELSEPLKDFRMAKLGKEELLRKLKRSWEARRRALSDKARLEIRVRSLQEALKLEKDQVLKAKKKLEDAKALPRINAYRTKDAISDKYKAMAERNGLAIVLMDTDKWKAEMAKLRQLFNENPDSAFDLCRVIFLLRADPSEQETLFAHPEKSAETNVVAERIKNKLLANSQSLSLAKLYEDQIEVLQRKLSAVKESAKSEEGYWSDRINELKDQKEKRERKLNQKILILKAELRKWKDLRLY